MGNIILFPRVKRWLLLRQFLEIEALCQKIMRIIIPLKMGRGSAEDLALSIRLLQKWAEDMDSLLTKAAYLSDEGE